MDSAQIFVIAISALKRLNKTDDVFNICFIPDNNIAKYQKLI